MMTEHHTQIEAICAHASVALIAVDENQRCTYMNPAAERMTGYLFAEAQGRPLSYVTQLRAPAEVLEPHHECLIKPLTGEQKHHGQAVFVHKDGHFYDVDFTATPLREGQKRIGTLIEVRDISEQKRTERALQLLNENLESKVLERTTALRDSQAEVERQAKFLDATISNVQSHIYVWDRNKRFVYVNRNLERLWGLTRDQWLGKTTAELGYPPELTRLFDRQIEQVFASGEMVRDEVKYTNPEGVSGYYEYVLSPVRDAGGRINLVAGVSRDTTERRRLEDALKEANEQLEQKVLQRTTYLRESEERYRTLFESIDQGFCIIKLLFDEQGSAYDYVFLETNPAFARQLGLPDLVGKHIRELTPDHEQHWFDTFGRVVHTGQAERRIDRAGSRWFDIYAFRVDGQEPDTLAVLFSDITERKRAEEELRRAYSLLEGITAGSEDLIAALDPHFHFLYFNNAYRREFKKLWDHDLREGDNLLEAMAQWPEEAKKAEELWRRALSGETFSITLEFGPSSDEMRIYDLHLNPLQDAEGRNVGAAHILRNVTEQAEFARAMRESEERYRLMGRATNDVLWDWNLENDYIEWNEAAVSQFGYTLDEMGHAPSGWYDRIHPEDAERIIADVHAAIDSGQQSWKDEYRFRKKDGTYAVFLDRGYIARDRNGRAYRMIGSMLNRTERRRAEEALRRTADADAYRVALTDAIRPHTDPVEIQTAVTRVLGQHLSANRVFYAEVSDDGKEAAVFTDYCHALRSAVGRYQLDEFGAAIMDRVRAGETLVIENVDTDHRLTDVERQATLELGVRSYVMVPLVKGGRAVAALAVHQSDPRHWSEAQIALIEETAERTWSAVERALAEESLRISEQRFRLLTDGIPHMVWRANAKGDFDFLSRQFTAYTGVSTGPVHGQDLTPRVIHPDDVTPTLLAWEQALRERRTFIVEHRVRSAEGEYRWFVSRAEPQIDERTGLVLRWYGTTTDIHDQKIAEETLRQADRQKDEFLAMLAHELRNPLAAVRNVGQLLNALTEEGSQTRHYVDILRRQTSTLSGLVEELLDVSRITRGLVDLKQERVDLSEVVDHALESVQALMDEKHHQITITLPRNTVPVIGDQVRLEQIVVNLLTNAAKYTDPHGHIFVTLASYDGQAEVRVADNGIGMTQDVIDRIFTLFGQAERGLDRAQGGLGIGLTVAKNLVESHGGTIEAHSRGLGTGAEFIIHLPMAPAEEDADLQSRTTEEEPTQPKRVLLVEDSVDVAETLAMLLENSGHQVTVAYSGHSALEKVDKADPDLILLDIGLPEMDGYELARRLRQMPHRRDTIMAALTGYGQPSDRARAEAAGFDAHFIKPVDWPTLQAFVGKNHSARPPLDTDAS